MKGMMQGFPPPADMRPSRENWDRAPYNRWTFQNVRMFVPTVPVHRGASASSLPRAPERLDDLAVTAPDDTGTTLDALLNATFTDGILVLHRGRVVFERYLNGMTERTLHLSQSVAKSFVGVLAGILWSRGLLDLDKPVSHYVPELARCGYRDALVGQVLDMRSGIHFDEDYEGLDNEMAVLDRACGWKPLRAGDPQGIYDLALTLKQARPHGGVFEYRSIETDVIGWVLSRITGLGLAELLSREIWKPMGAEFDANFTVDRAGTCLADGGLNAALRDYARFGQLMLDEGFHNGRQIVPADWIAQCRDGDHAAFEPNYGAFFTHSPRAAYSRQWWVLDPARGRHVALGVFGQMIWIDPVDQLVVTTLSSWPDFLNAPFRLSIFRACEAIGRALNGAGR